MHTAAICTGKEDTPVPVGTPRKTFIKTFMNDWKRQSIAFMKKKREQLRFREPRMGRGWDLALLKALSGGCVVIGGGTEMAFSPFLPLTSQQGWGIS